ncbi:hypothetical protein Y032_0033g2646 [Ancylostoma ceylanicum]|uniref:Uncharacterized protein n=1 Tax=Ancylostoma ceylanicum TaxID=53326 RepID=A0A016UPL4_9BILA|nr:hypothetical protein Y032_0033g2646 [Ancylostoma ceylanicum]
MKPARPGAELATCFRPLSSESCRHKACRQLVKWSTEGFANCRPSFGVTSCRQERSKTSFRQPLGRASFRCDQTTSSGGSERSSPFEKSRSL